MSTAVIACGEKSVATMPPDVWTVDELCLDPSRMIPKDEADRIVLLLHRGRFDLSSVQRAVRTMGIDPLGVQILEVGDEAPTTAALQGLIARAEAFAGSRPEQAKPVVPIEMTRRSFRYPPTPEYVAAPLIDGDRCAASSGCRACVSVCPQDAYTWQDGRVAHDLDACLPCGRCASACPTGAISNPSASPSMIESQVRAIIGTAHGSVGIRFVCSRGSMSPASGLEDVLVPCTSMVPATWMLACLSLGATEARAVPCAESGCPLGLDTSADRANRLAAATLQSVGARPDELVGLLGEGWTSPFGYFAQGGAAGLVEALADAANSSIEVRDESAPMGLVEIDRASCTLCGQCAKVCPTGALMETYEDDRVTISFDPRLCVNCSQCTAMCPEYERGAIRVRGGFDSAAISRGPRILSEASASCCELCGEVFAPAPMMGRVAELLGPEFGSTMEMIAARCLGCRGR